MTTTINRWGTGFGIRIPKSFMEKFPVMDKEKLAVEFMDQEKIVFTRIKEHKSLRQRVEEYYGMDFEAAIAENPYDFEEVDWGKPEGDEIW